MDIRIQLLRYKKVSSTSASQTSANLEVTLGDSDCPTESQDVRLASPSLVTFFLAATEASGAVPGHNKPVEDPTPPSTARLATGTLLVIAAVSAVTISLSWLDWPFRQADIRNRQGMPKNGSGNARHYKNAVARPNVASDSFAGGVIHPHGSTAGGGTPNVASPPERYALDDDIDSRESFAEVHDMDTTLLADGLDTRSPRGTVLMSGLNTPRHGTKTPLKS
ncbi:hypothetical protein V5799_021084 [Amblyomma americanum]|uniref:Uncharacterized protein n=1 Tax=Amblyomma americanum TaxID=6943 RepID=A0AAQ4FPE8_AMBAM